ncbi:MAG: hypothetical protein QOG64_3043, partial [Acidimicrobiaceae bacterium]|nr:hypothetical protein [Acidimicrobiaceae bacterium]
MGWMAQRGVSEEDKLSADEAKRVLRRSLAFLKPYRAQCFFALFVMLMYTLATVAGPALIRLGIDNGLKNHDGATLDKIAIAFVAVAIVAVVLSRAQILLVSRVGEQFLRDLRVRVFDHIQAMSMGFFDTEQTGKLVARMTSDIDSLQELIQLGLVQFVTNGLLLVGLLFALIAMSWELALICLLALPPVVLASIRFRNDSNKAYLIVRDRIGQTLSTLQEGLSGVRVIQAFGQENSQVRRFAVRNQAQLEANMEAV